MKDSTTAGRMCCNPEFQQFLGVTSADAAATYVRRHCGVASRRELDTNPEAARKWHELRRRFAYGEAA